MPELPEVETVKGGLERAVLGGRIKGLRVNRYDLRIPVPQDLGQRLSAQTIHEISRRGKYIIMHIGDSYAVLHLGMSGRIRIFAAASDYEARKHDHIIFEMEDGGLFAFEDPRRFGMFYLAGDDGWAVERPFSQMGPEPLDDEWTGTHFYNAINKRKAPIKGLLLDQAIVAGLGNIYVCEALYGAGVDPRRGGDSISKAEADKIVVQSKQVLERAIAAGGSTLRDYQKTDGSLGYFQYGFQVYDRDGHDCPLAECNQKILRIVQAGRSTFYCPSCQK